MVLQTRRGAPAEGLESAVIGSVYLSRAARAYLPRAAASAGAMSGTACWLAALSAAGLLAAAVMVRSVRGRRP